jgi:hypothetical protein
MSPVKKKTTIFFFDRYFLDRCYIMLFLFLSLLCYHSQARVTPFGGRDHYRSAIEQNAKPSTKVTTKKKPKTFKKKMIIITHHNHHHRSKCLWSFGKQFEQVFFFFGWGERKKESQSHT